MTNKQSMDKGYYIYSIIAISGFLFLFGIIIYLTYDIVVKLATNQFTNVTIIQSIITLTLTVFVGGYYSKNLEYKNNLRLETYKSQKEIAIRIIDLAGYILRKEEEEKAKLLLANENYKVKLLFDDELVTLINSFLDNSKTETYNDIVNQLKKYF